MNNVLLTPLRVFRLACLASLMVLTACATSTPPDNPASKAPSSPQVAPNFDAPQGTAALDPGQNDSGALESLWRSRAAQGSGDTSLPDFAIGPGDVLRISLPQLDQMKDRTVRVSEHDTIDLPMLGVINVAGMSQEDLRNELSRRVAKYVYRPQVAVYLEETQNRLAAVLGAVRTPGRYMLAGRSETIMTMLSRAGGRTEDAASRIILIPAPITAAHAEPVTVSANDEQPFPAAGQSRSDVASSSSRSHFIEPVALSSQTMADGVVIDLSRSANQRYLTLPVRSGDVIIVPAAGEVTVQGWVDKPGAFKITPGMTVLSALAAAGGAVFTSSATLLREQGNGSKSAIPVDISKVQHGTEPDIPLQGGDVVVANRSVVGAIPYSGYFFLNHMGIGVPLIP
jgi:polysaccharide biosynthesis/export protein